MRLSPQVLSAEERAFIAALPVVRVAVPLPPAQPYEVLGPDGEVSGIHPEMLMALGQAFGLRLQPLLMPSWSAALQAAKNREVDLVMTVGVTAERLQYLEFTLGATPLPGALFARSGMSGEALAQSRIALERNYLANDHVKRQYPHATIVTVETTGDALRAVGEGRADYYLGSLLEATAWLEREPVAGIEINRMMGYGTGFYHFGVRKDWAPLAGILNKGIQTLRAAPNAELSAALGNLPARLKMPAPLPLGADELALLSRRAVWRLGAVRGLTMLNDIDANAVHSGIGAEYAEQVARRLGVATQVVAFDNVAAMLAALREGSIDVVPFLTRTAGRAADFAFSAPYIEMPYLLVARSDGPLYWGLDSLRGRRLALALEHPLREIIAKHYPEIKVVDATNGNDAMDRVAQGDADAAAEVKLFANLRINGDNDGRLRAVTPIEELPAQFHFATSRQAAALIPLLNRALADIPTDEKQRMLRRWVAVDLNPAFAWRRWMPLIAVALGALLLLAASTAWWLRSLSREVAARRRSEQLLNDIGNTMPGVAFRYALGHDGHLQHVWVTPSARAFLGVEIDHGKTVLGNMLPRMPPEQREAALAEEAACAASGERFRMTASYAHPDGGQRWLHAEAVQTRSAQGSSVWTGYLVDVSTERELQAQLAREAESRNLMLASASHELRAPTHTLSLALQSLTPEGLNEPQRAALRIAANAAHTLTQLLGDVLDAARFDHEPLRLEVQTFELRGLLQNIADAWQAVALSKGLAFELTVAADVPQRLVMDPLRLEQILANLLSNACKHSAAGGVSLQATCAAGRLLLVVTDQGSGIAADLQAQLFTPYVTAGAAAAVAEGSTGLGLAICRRLAGLMGGSISLRSEPGSGTVVSVELPLREPATGTVLVCDDDPTSRLLMAEMLRRQGYTVEETGEASAALARWRQGGLACLITDLEMPGLSGRELIRLLRDEEAQRGGHIAVVVCSGSPVLAEGAAHDAYLIKPVDMRALTQTLVRLGVEG